MPPSPHDPAANASRPVQIGYSSPPRRWFSQRTIQSLRYLALVSLLALVVESYLLYGRSVPTAHARYYNLLAEVATISGLAAAALLIGLRRPRWLAILLFLAIWTLGAMLLLFQAHWADTGIPARGGVRYFEFDLVFRLLFP